MNWLALLAKYRGYWQKKSIAEAAKYYHELAERDKQARKAYQDLKPSTSILDEIYILDIMRGGVSDDKLRI